MTPGDPIWPHPPPSVPTGTHRYPMVLTSTHRYISTGTYPLAWYSRIRLLAVGIFDLGQIEKTVTIFFQLNIEIEYKTQYILCHRAYKIFVHVFNWFFFFKKDNDNFILLGNFFSNFFLAWKFKKSNKKILNFQNLLVVCTELFMYVLPCL